MLLPDQWPELPAAQLLTAAKVEKGVKVVIGDHIAFPRLAIKREHDKENLVTEQSLFDAAIYWQKGGVVLGWIGRALLEIERKHREPMPHYFILILPAGETQQLEQLPSILASKAVKGQQRVNKIKLLRFDHWIFRAGKKRRHRQCALGVSLLTIKERPKCFHSLPKFQRQRIIVEQEASIPISRSIGPELRPSQTAQTAEAKKLG
ncbi:MAG: hypothetical protein AAB380_01355 [Verrucomicrobiota bacterium]